MPYHQTQKELVNKMEQALYKMNATYIALEQAEKSVNEKYSAITADTSRTKPTAQELINLSRAMFDAKKAKQEFSEYSALL